MNADTALAARVAELEAMFASIARTRMLDVPILHAGLHVQAVGFEPVVEPPATVGQAGAGAAARGRADGAAWTGDADAADGTGAPAPEAAVGVLVTPWFMNLVWLPLQRPGHCAPVGETRERCVGNTRFAFIGAFEMPVGAYEACSLFSPMQEFEDHAAAVAVAEAVLAQLRRPQPPAQAEAASGTAIAVDARMSGTSAPAGAAAGPSQRTPAPARRRFLLGRAGQDSLR